MVGRRSLLGGSGAERVQGWRERLDEEGLTPRQRFTAHQRTLLAMAAYLRRAGGGVAEEELWEDATDALREVLDEFAGRLEAAPLPRSPGGVAAGFGGPKAHRGNTRDARVGTRVIPDGD